MTEVRSPLTGGVWQILVAVGDQVGAGDELLVIESMKMEFAIEAPHAGSVVAVAVAQGAHVEEGDLLLTLG